jgi:hypothetical protein
MRVLALVTGIVLLVAAGVLFLSVAIVVIPRAAVDADTQLGLAIFLIAAVLIAAVADLLIIAAVRQSPTQRLVATLGPAAGRRARRPVGPQRTSLPVLVVLAPILTVIVVTGTVASWLVRGLTAAIGHKQRLFDSERVVKPPRMGLWKRILLGAFILVWVAAMGLDAGILEAFVYHPDEVARTLQHNHVLLTLAVLSPVVIVGYLWVVRQGGGDQ